jgi:hypothetical protein
VDAEGPDIDLQYLISSSADPKAKFTRPVIPGKISDATRLGYAATSLSKFIGEVKIGCLYFKIPAAYLRGIL